LTTVLVFEPDLIFSSKIEAAAAKAGVEIVVTSRFEELLRQLKLFIPKSIVLNLDASTGELDALKDYIKLGTIEFVGYYSHVNVGLQEEARRLGIENVLSRGTFVSRLEGIMQGLRQ
jgi:hypothetical protein